jgi:hypothetical protein
VSKDVNKQRIAAAAHARLFLEQNLARQKECRKFAEKKRTFSSNQMNKVKLV